MSKSEQILAILNERYACGALPYGALKAIGDEVGSTRELVRQVANRSGFAGRLHQKDRKRLCQCGKEMEPRVRKCIDCRTVPISCFLCGMVVRRKATEVINGTRHKGYVGRQFCSQKCRSSWLGKSYGWGNPGHPIHAKKSSSLTPESTEMVNNARAENA